jgi:hypothetical protein
MPSHHLGRCYARTKPFHIHSSILVKLKKGIGDTVWIDFDGSTLYISANAQTGWTKKTIGGIGKNTNEDYYGLNANPARTSDKWSSAKDLPDWFDVKII